MLCSLGLNFPSPAGGPCCPGKLGIKPCPFVLHSCLQHQFQPKSLGIPQHSNPLSFLISRIINPFQDLSSSQDLHHLHFRPSFSLRNHFSGALLLNTSFLSRNPKPGLSHLNSVCLHVQLSNWWFSLMSLLISGFRKHHFCSFQVLSEFMTSPYWLQLASSKFMFKNAKAQFQRFAPTHTHTPNYLLPVSIYSSSYFYHLQQV